MLTAAQNNNGTVGTWPHLKQLLAYDQNSSILKKKPIILTAIITALALFMVVLVSLFTRNNLSYGDLQSGLNSSGNNSLNNTPDQTKANESQQSTDNSSSSATNNSSTSITVNGQTIDAPANGSYSQTTTDGNGTTSVKVDSSHSSSSTGSGSSNNSSTSVNVSSHSDSSN